MEKSVRNVDDWDENVDYLYHDVDKIECNVEKQLKNVDEYFLGCG